MKPRRLLAILVDGARGVARGRFLTVAAVLVIGITFAVAAGALLAAENLSMAVRDWARPDDIRVYLGETATVAEAAALAARWRGDPRVDAVQVIGPDDARREFADAFPEMSEFVDLLEGSPFPPEVALTMREDLTDAVRTDLVRRLESEPGVVAALSDDLWAGRLLESARLVRRTGQGAGVLFALAAALVVAGIIRISLAARRDEISVMTLVGAPRVFIAGPFVVEGVVLGALGGALAVLLASSGFALVAGWAGHPLAGLISTAWLPVESWLAIVAGAGVAGGLAAAWTVSRSLP